MVSDIELLDRWRAGDLTAGNVLFDRYFGEMVRFFESKRCRDVEDLVQKTFLACVQSRDRFRNQCSFRTYLLLPSPAASSTSIFGHFSRHGGNLDFGVTSLADLHTGPSGQVARNQEHGMLLQALCALPLEQQLLIEMFYWQGMALPDLAEIFDVAEATVRTRLFRARKALGELLEKLAARPGTNDESAESFEAWIRSLRDQPEEPG